MANLANVVDRKPLTKYEEMVAWMIACAEQDVRLQAEAEDEAEEVAMQQRRNCWLGEAQ